MRVPAFNDLPREQADALLHGCLSVPRWVEQVAVSRPYAGWPDLRAAAAGAAVELTDSELDEALAGHPRIGERAGAGHAVEHSRGEQSGVDLTDREVAQRLAAGNAAYEQRFGRVFLIRAAGRSAPQILAELERRLASSDLEERAETVRQLGEIAVLRLETLIDPAGGTPDAATT